MDLHAGYELRAPAPSDLDAVGDLLIADEIEEAGQIILGADFVRERWSRADFDLAADAWVVLDPAGTIVGYGEIVRRGPGVVESLGVVRSDHKGRGIGSSLLDGMEERASAMLAGLPSPTFRHAINARDRAAAAMLRTRGLVPVRYFWHMVIDLARTFEPGPAPEGIEIRGIDPGDDLAAVHSVLDEAFADDWSYHPEPIDKWVEDQTRSPSYDPTLWLLATTRGEPVGVLTANVWGERGWVSEVGVLAPYRGRGIGAALLRRSFATFADRGLRSVMLNVDAGNPTGATALYERVGMQVIRRWDLWERTAT